MSLTLRESCTLYERHCRRNKNIPTFNEFNSNYLTCLPADTATFNVFKSTLIAAKRAEGLPVRRRLPSLYKRLSSGSTFADPSTKSDDSSTKSDDSHKAFVSCAVPSYENGLRMNIRPTASSKTESVVVLPESTTETEAEIETDLAWSLEAYKQELASSTNPKLKESTGMMIHFIPPTRCAPLEALACKFTKKCYETLQGKEQHAIKMRDNSVWPGGANWNQDDVTAVLQMRKKKTAGPYFIRVDGI